MFSLQNRHAFIQSLRGDVPEKPQPSKAGFGKNTKANVPAFLKTNSKETMVHDTSSNSDGIGEKKKQETVKKVKRKKEDYIRFDVL